MFAFRSPSGSIVTILYFVVMWDGFSDVFGGRRMSMTVLAGFASCDGCMVFYHRVSIYTRFTPLPIQSPFEALCLSCVTPLGHITLLSTYRLDGEYLRFSNTSVVNSMPRRCVTGTWNRWSSGRVRIRVAYGLPSLASSAISLLLTYPLNPILCHQLHGLHVRQSGFCLSLFRGIFATILRSDGLLAVLSVAISCCPQLMELAAKSCELDILSPSL